MLEDLEVQPPVRRCKVRTVIESLGPDDQKILIGALANPLWGDLPLSNALAERDIVISNMSIRKHRDHRCSCRLLTNA